MFFFPDLSLTEISHHVVNDLLNFCTWMKDRSDLNLDVEEECIVPIIKFFLEDANQEVAKTAYSHLAVMINRGKISKREYPRTVQGSCEIASYETLAKSFKIVRKFLSFEYPTRLSNRSPFRSNRIVGEPLL